ncbi:hypothetical protein JCM10908_002983 [Rhodotorula pacifica]|uniref:uncharacterized protein n=1 Tax=Rhodotorula pacifica TaxID=1495444 RepID=UPI003173FBEC
MSTSEYDYRTSTVQEDRKRAQEVYDRVERQSRQRRTQHAGSGSNDAQDGQEGANDDERQVEAIKRIQGGYRAHVKRREGNGCNISSSKRWDDGVRQRQLKSAADGQDQGDNDVASRWSRGKLFAAQISEGKHGGADGAEKDLSEHEEGERFGRNEKEKAKLREERKAAKQMEATYWLEMVDRKHRYASNLKWYHQKWNETDTDDNFFHWLDEGDGKELDLEQCPRNRLESERIRYLNAEEREVYRVEVNESGLLVWAKDGSLLDTGKYHKDRGPDKGGIVEISEEEFREDQRKEDEKLKEMEEEGKLVNVSSRSSSSSSSSSDVADEIREGTRAYDDKGGTAGQGKGVRQAKERVKYYISPRHLGDRLLRKTINKNTWLYVSDLQNNLYVGIKKTGAFQHSSFLYGARVTSAGLIKASKGHLTSLSPLSGHYRAGTMHFKAFARSLEEQGVDLKKVNISKSVLTIRGIEKYGKVTKKKKALKEKLKSIFTGEKPEDEKEQEKDRAEANRIHNEEEGEGHEAHERDVHEQDDQVRRHREREDKPLPGEGKRIEEMTDEERLERGVALVQRAFEKGLSLKADKADQVDKPDASASGAAGKAH